MLDVTDVKEQINTIAAAELMIAKTKGNLDSYTVSQYFNEIELHYNDKQNVASSFQMKLTLPKGVTVDTVNFNNKLFGATVQHEQFQMNS